MIVELQLTALLTLQQVILRICFIIWLFQLQFFQVRLFLIWS